MIRKYSGQMSAARRGFIIAFCTLFTAYCLLTSCGKKGDPTLKSYEKPDSPSELRAIHRESEIILFWKFPKEREPAIKGFNLMKSTGTDFEKVAFIENNNRSYRDTNFKIGTEYKYKIISQNLRDVTSNDSNIIEINPKSLPASPEDISFKIDHDSLMLTWKRAGEGIVYNIYKKDKKGTYSLTPVNKEPIAESLFRDTMDIKKPVYYTIRSLWGGEIRDEGYSSEELEIDPSEFIPSPPSALQAVVTEENVYLIWKESPETWVAGYRIYREVNEEGFVCIGTSQTPVFVDKDKPLTRRNYKITALGPSKESPPAEVRNVVFIPQR